MFECKAIIWDLDGTLVDTLGDLRLGVNLALADGGYPATSLEEARIHIGYGARNFVRMSLPEGVSDVVIEETFARFRQHYSQHLTDNSLPYDGIPEVLDEFRRQGIRMAVFSNKYDAATRQMCAKLLPGKLDAAVGEQAGIPRKPSPEGVYNVLRLLGASPEETVYIGDSETDAATARNAGVRFVGVLWGLRSREDMMKEGATVFAAEPKELTQLIGGAK